MADRILIQCPGCSAKLAISDESKLGKKIRCSKCSEVFVAKALKAGGSAAPAKPKPKPKKSDEDEFNFDDMEMEDKSEPEEEESEEESKPVRSKAGAKKGTKAKGKTKKKSSGGNLPLIIGGVVVVVLLLAVGGYFLFSGGEPVAAPAPPPVAPAPVAAAVVQDFPNDKILALKWLPQDTELIIHLKIADVWQAPLLQGLLSGPQAAGGVAQMQQMTGLAPTDLESVTIGLKNVEQLQGKMAMMAFGGPPPTDASGLVVMRSKKPVEVSKIQQLIVQSIPNQVAKVADHNGKSYIEVTPPSAPAGFGPPPTSIPGAVPAGTPPGFGAPPGVASAPGTGGAKPMGAWFADTNTLILGPREELFDAMDRGETVAPRNEFRAIDASPHLLFVVAPKDPKMFSTPAGAPSAAMAPGEAEMQKALQESLRAASFGVNVTGGVGLQWSLVCADPASAAKLKPEMDKFVGIAKSKFAAERGSLPPFAGELLEMLINNIQISEQGQSVRVATSIPESAQQKLEQLPTMLAGLLPAVQQAREAARRSQGKNNLKQIALAMNNFHDTYSAFPAAASTDNKGQPRLSWRVYILPFIEEFPLYQQFHLDEPWDSEHNKKLIEKMPVVYQSPNDPELNKKGKTRYLVPCGAGTIFEKDGKEGEFSQLGLKMRDILDGTSNTIMTVEAHPDAAVIWTKPEDLVIDFKNPLKGLKSALTGGFQAGWADGSVRFINDNINLDNLKALFTRAGGEVVNDF